MVIDKTYSRAGFPSFGLILNHRAKRPSIPPQLSRIDIPSSYKANMFTPEHLLSTPRRGPAVPNSNGSLVIFSQSTHAIGGQTSKGYFVLNIETGSIDQLITDDSATNAVWLGHDNSTVLFLSREEGGITLIKTVDATDIPAEAIKIGQIDAPVSDLKVKALKDESVALVVVGLVGADGTLYNKERQESPLHSGKIYDSMYPRTVSILNPWDTLSDGTHTVGFVRRAPDTHSLVYKYPQGGWCVAAHQTSEEYSSGHKAKRSARHVRARQSWRAF